MKNPCWYLAITKPGVQAEGLKTKLH